MPCCDAPVIVPAAGGVGGGVGWGAVWAGGRGWGGADDDGEQT